MRILGSGRLLGDCGVCVRSRRGETGEGLYGGLSVCGSAVLVGSVVVGKRVYR